MPRVDFLVCSFLTSKIQVIYNGTISAESACYFPCFLGATSNLQAPDCLLSTGDIEFCQNQPIPVATEPRDIEVEWTIESTSAIVHINWSMPLVVNGEIARYSLIAMRLMPEANGIPIFQADKNDTTFQITPDNPGIFEGGFMTGYSYEILIKAVVYLPVEYRSEGTFGGNIATKLIYIPATDVTTPFDETTSERSQTVTKIELTLVVVLASSVFAVLVVVAFVIIMLTYRRNRKAVVYDHGVILQVRTSHHEVVKEELALPEFRDKEVYGIDDIELVGEPIGGGQYGMVYMGYLRLEKGIDDRTKVAVKTTRDGLSAVMREDFLDEIRLMIEIGEHPNIMPVIACKTITEPYYLITEYMDYGSLLDYLRKCNKPENVKLDSIYTLTELGQLNIAYQIASGMEHLSSTRFFHGDLAARNILINKKMEVKISDFGLSNDIYAKGYVRLPPENKRPVKWYSPEANIDGRCSTAGDVWSYGIVLYEIFVFGREPYQGMTPREVIVRVKAGYRLEKPEDCPDEVYDIMWKCWQYEPSQRPTFKSIKQSLEKLLNGDEEQESSDQQVEPFQYRASYLSIHGDEETTSSSIYD
ncbi:Fibroblast growth factor receptor 1 [Holothuria leucospilota]|uniref:Fibroblast growth factor receptor 1 n=1 Tax=Holothuria leucospilota TaxID=206669 RepID=A0A9Q0YL33_HOLLE|nr:Fibroblast growth factor receptor 1 [Holothuria leucospilota]